MQLQRKKKEKGEKKGTSRTGKVYGRREEEEEEEEEDAEVVGYAVR